MSQAEEINIKQAATDALVPDVKPNVATTLSDDVPRVDYVEEPCLYKQHAHPDINAVVPNTTNDPATCPINTASVDSTIFTANIMLDHVSNMNADGAGKQKKIAHPNKTEFATQHSSDNQQDKQGPQTLQSDSGSAKMTSASHRTEPPKKSPPKWCRATAWHQLRANTVQNIIESVNESKTNLALMPRRDLLLEADRHFGYYYHSDFQLNEEYIDIRNKFSNGTTGLFDELHKYGILCSKTGNERHAVYYFERQPNS